jgi:hypothetical protein
MNIERVKFELHEHERRAEAKKQNNKPQKLKPLDNPWIKQAPKRETT